MRNTSWSLVSIKSPLVSDVWPRRCRRYGLNRGCSGTETDFDLYNEGNEVLWVDRKETFNKLNQMSTKPSASASTVGVAVNGFLLLSNNSAYHLCATQADLYKWNGRSQVMHVELSPIKQSCVIGLPPNKETQLGTREERRRRKVVLQQKKRD